MKRIKISLNFNVPDDQVDFADDVMSMTENQPVNMCGKETDQCPNAKCAAWLDMKTTCVRGRDSKGRTHEYIVLADCETCIYENR